MKKIIGTIALIISGATGWILIEPTLNDDVVQEELAIDISQFQETVEQNNSPDEIETEDVVLNPAEAQVETKPQISVEDTIQEVYEDEIISGSFRGNNSYTAEGEVYISGSDLSLVNLDSTNVPDGFVYLSKDLKNSDGLRVARLKGNKGNQNYSLPVGVSADDYQYVLIWCRAFSSLVGYAKIN